MHLHHVVPVLVQALRNFKLPTSPLWRILYFVDINECASSPCVNGGSCVDAINGYTCSCVAGYTGVLCETSENATVHVVSPLAAFICEVKRL